MAEGDFKDLPITTPSKKYCVKIAKNHDEYQRRLASFIYILLIKILLAEVLKMKTFLVKRKRDIKKIFKRKKMKTCSTKN